MNENSADVNHINYPQTECSTFESESSDSQTSNITNIKLINSFVHSTRQMWLAEVTISSNSYWFTRKLKISWLNPATSNCSKDERISPFPCPDNHQIKIISFQIQNAMKQTRIMQLFLMCLKKQLVKWHIWNMLWDIPTMLFWMVWHSFWCNIWPWQRATIL